VKFAGFVVTTGPSADGVPAPKVAVKAVSVGSGEVTVNATL
jgi:hypothetical protein